MPSGEEETARAFIDWEARAGVQEIRQKIQSHEAICELRQGHIIAGLSELKTTVATMRSFGITQLVAALGSAISIALFLLWYVVTHGH